MIIRRSSGIVKIYLPKFTLQLCKVKNRAKADHGSSAAGGGATWTMMVVPSGCVCITAM